MPHRHVEGATPERPPRHAEWAALVIVVGLLLFTWPFLRTPPLGIGASLAHLIGAWVAIIGALALLSRAIGRSGRGGRGA